MRDRISTLGRQRLDIFFENSASDTQGNHCKNYAAGMISFGILALQDCHTLYVLK